MSRNTQEHNKFFDPRIEMGLHLRPMTQTLTGNITLDRDSPVIVNLNLNGSARTLTLPTEEEGLVFILNNISGTAVDLTINNPAAAGIGTLSQAEAGIVFCAGGVWYFRLFGTTT